MSTMHTRFLSLALLAIVVPAQAQSDDGLYREMQLEVSRAYSACAAFYESAASNSSVVNGLTMEDAGAMQNESITRAVLHAADVEGDAEGRRLANADYAKIKTELSELADADPEAFADAMSEYRRSCRMGVIDPSTFIKKTLVVGRWRTTEFRLPEGLTIEELLKNATPVERVPEISDCSHPAIAHLLSLDDVLVESGMICPKHEDGVCDNEREWMSYAQFVEERYPNNEMIGYTAKLSIRFKGGKTLQERTLIACIVVPEVRT